MWIVVVREQIVDRLRWSDGLLERPDNGVHDDRDDDGDDDRDDDGDDDRNDDGDDDRNDDRDHADRQRHTADRSGDDHEPRRPGDRWRAADDVRLPATFTILPGDSLSPATITAPERIPVALTVISGDGRSHRVLVRTPVRYVLTVPAHGRGSILLTGVKAGRYPLDVDGTARGTLVIGGAPGP